MTQVTGEPVRQRVVLPAEHRSVVLARRMVRSVLESAGLAGPVADAVLLTSEVCENAVLHAGTPFELDISLAGGALTVAVTDHGSAPLERRRVEPAVAGSRAATHGRGLLLVDEIAAAWGTRHSRSGRQVWFTLTADGTTPSPPDLAPVGVAEVPGAGGAAGTPDVGGAAAAGGTTGAAGGDGAWPELGRARWLLRLPSVAPGPGATEAVVTEALRRLAEVTDATVAEVWVDSGDGVGEVRVAAVGGPPDEGGTGVVVALPVSAPLRGRLVVYGPVDATEDAAEVAAEVAELVAERVAMAVEAEWLRGEAARRRSWTTFLAETSELLAQSLDVRLTSAIVPQLVVPRLGEWCAVHLLDSRGRPILAAASHTDEAELPGLRGDLAHNRAAVLEPVLAAARRGSTAATGLSGSRPCVAVPLAAHGQRLGILTVGRPPNRVHSSEEVMLIADVARRAALAIDNARRNAEHVATSQALQEALLPRALPTAAAVEFAAEYRPASAGADVGGDFYDVVELGAGHWLAAIGDVCGKGARAAARAGQVRDVLRVLTRAGNGLAGSLALLNDVLLESGRPDQYCTVAATGIRREPDGVLVVELLLAGHLRPFLLRAGGTGRFVGQVGTAAGLIDEFVVQPEVLRLYPGDALVAYTDGVTERRRGADQFGDERLAETILGAAGRSASELAAAVRTAVEEFAGGPHRDDLAVLVVRAAPHGT